MKPKVKQFNAQAFVSDRTCFLKIKQAVKQERERILSEISARKGTLFLFEIIRIIKGEAK